jgi:O-antigen/teichoic acid export membrane protein
MGPLVRLRAAMPRGGFVRGALAIASATGAAQLISILSAPIVTRLYTPSDYGAYAVAGSLLTVLIAVACVRYDLAIPLPKSDSAAANVLALCLVAVVAVTLVSLPILWLVGPRILDTIGAAVLSPYVFLISIGVLSGGIVAAFTGWMIRTKSYSEIAANRLTQSGTLVAAQIGFGLLGLGAAGLLIGTVAGNIAGTGRLVRAAWRRSATSFRSVSRQEVVSTAKRYRRFPIYSAPSAFLNNVGLEAPLLLIVAIYGTGVGGQFALAQRVVALPVFVLAAAVGQVYFAEAARLQNEDPTALRRLFWRTTRSLALTAIGPFLLAALLAPLLFGLLFGQAWSEAGLYVAILAPMYFLQFVATPTGGTLDVLERQDLHLVREIGRLCLIGGAILAASALGLTATQTVIAVSVAGCVTNSLYGFISWRAIVTHHPVAHAATDVTPVILDGIPGRPDGGYALVDPSPAADPPPRS